MDPTAMPVPLTYWPRATLVVLANVRVDDCGVKVSVVAASDVVTGLDTTIDGAPELYDTTVVPLWTPYDAATSTPGPSCALVPLSAMVVVRGSTSSAVVASVAVMGLEMTIEGPDDEYDEITVP